MRWIGDLGDAIQREHDAEIAAGDVLRILHNEFGSSLSAGHIELGSSLPAGDGKTRSAIGVVRGAPAERVEEYLTSEAGQMADPLLRAARKRLGPVHDQQLFSGDSWQEHRFYRANARRFGNSHYLVFPVFAERSLLGTFHLCRRRGHRPFSDGDLFKASLASAHLTVQLDARATTIVEVPRLTFRERQIGRMAAHGLSNPQIAADLGLQRETVKKTLGRLYLKLGVQSRAQMAVILATHSML